jgi:hypothetical protein
MQPRLKTSKKWTSFPKEYTDQIKTVFEENFEADMDDESIVVEGRIYATEVLLRVGLVQPGRLRQANFEVSMEYSAKNKDALERIHNGVDAVASMMADYFENQEKADLPLIWQSYPFQGKTVFLQFSTVNSNLEKQADALLGELAEDLVVDKEEEDEDALTRAETDPSLAPDLEDDGETGVADDDDEEEDEVTKPQAPRMFSGTKTPKKH